ncbi:hypothetical protein [Ligilactobacillus salivarius]|uniref:hypothetical protein n=1 Tax=Ligilactobacillus salivarius TaxID=1624 RepID=UPI0031FEAA79
MAKTIKFNLILDNHPVRNIEELQEHFSIEDMLKYFENGLLLRWLKVRGYEKEYIAVENIGKSLGNKDIIVSLLKIFKMNDIDIDDIEKEVSILEYQNEKRKLNEIYKENSFTKEQIIEDYHAGYNALILHIEKNKDNMAILKADAVQMEREYSRLFSLNYYELYFRLLNSAPKAIFAMLTRDIFRKCWLDEKSKSSALPTTTAATAAVSASNSIQEGLNRFKKIYARDQIKSSIETDARDQIKSSIESLLNSKSAEKILGDDLKIVRENTEEMWDPIEKSTVKVLIISIARGTFIKNAGDFSEKLGYEDVNKKLLRLNGLEYQSNSAVHKLLYMEV